MRRLIPVLLTLALASCAWAAPPTISAIALSAGDHDSVRICFTVSPTSSYVQTLYGTVTGTYTNQATRMYQATNDSGNGNVCQAISGLKDSTQYFFLPIAQPNATNATDICNVGGCGAVEQTYTTGSASPPITPTAPTAYNPVRPDTSGYVTVSMVPGGPAGECVAASSVGLVTAGQVLQTVLNEITYSYRLKFSQTAHASPCITPAVNSYSGNPGYILTHHAGYDATCSTGWIVLDTDQVNSGDFPPAGTATSPTLSAQNAIFQTEVTGGSGNVGAIFSSDFVSGLGSQCYWVENFIARGDPAIVVSQFTTMLSTTSVAGDTASDQVVWEHIYIAGNTVTGGYRGVELGGHREAFRDSYIDNIFTVGNFPTGIFWQGGSSGPFNITNNYVNAYGLAVYGEITNGSSSAANDVTLDRTFIYMNPTLAIANNWRVRQPFEIKQGQRVQMKGGMCDGSLRDQNEGPCFFVSGTNTYGAGSISDVLIDSTLIRNAVGPFDAFGMRPSDNNPGSDNAVAKRVMFRNNLAYNIGLPGRLTNTGPGLIMAYIINEPGVADLTVTGNTFAFQDAFDSRPLSPIGYIPAYLEYGGLGTFSSNFTNTNNVFYLNSDGSSSDRIAPNEPTYPTSYCCTYPRLPADVTGSTPVARLNGYAITTTNAGTTPAYTWSGNVVICGKLDAIQNNVWTDMNQTQCNTAASGMPPGDTYAAGATTSAREAAIGLNTTTWACSGCGGAGVASKLALYPAMGIVTNIATPSAGATSASFSYTAPDSATCAVDTSPDGTTWTRTTDAGGGTSRTPTVSGLAQSVTYNYRILCTKQQINNGILSEAWPASQVTEGTLLTLSSPKLVQYSGPVRASGAVH